MAVETSRMLGMGTELRDAEGLPTLGDGGAVPLDLAETHGELVVPACGFCKVTMRSL